MSAQRTVAFVLVMTLWLSGGAYTHSTDAVIGPGAAAAADVADLQDQLESGLKARLPAEFAFIRRVVNLVNANRLPLDMVMSTFKWARRKTPYPFPYFERALRIRAARLGIVIRVDAQALLPPSHAILDTYAGSPALSAFCA